jgi:hypothetical protein
MKKQPTRSMIKEAARQGVRERPEAKQALDSLAKLIVESFVKTIPQDMAAGLSRRLKTKEGKKEFAESWPIIWMRTSTPCATRKSDERRPR